MRAYGFSALSLVLAIQAGVWSLAWAQETPPFGQAPESFGEEFEETEQLPRFQVEIIAFSYHAFDPTEEQFHRKSAPTELNVTPGVPVEPLPGGSPRGIDPYQPGPWSSTNPAVTEGTGPPVPHYPGVESRETGNDLEPGSELGPGALLGQPVEEQLSISEQILSTMLALEEEPDPLNPLDPSDPSSPPTAADSSAPSAQNPSTGSGDVIAVEERFGPFDPLQPETTAAAPAEEPFQFRFLTREELELTPEATRLNRLDAYTVLAHGGWVQEGLPEEHAHPFNITMLGTLNPTGTVQLHLSRFLHVTVALDYRAAPPRPVTPTPVPPTFPTYSDVLEEFSLPPVYELRATRRTRSGELHYFDHPAFGLLVVVRPAPELPEDSEETEESLDPPLGPAA